MISNTPTHTLVTPLGKVEIRANGDGKVTVDNRTGCNQYHEVIVNSVKAEISVTLEMAESDENDGRTIWRSLVMMDDYTKQGRGLFWGYEGYGVNWRNECNRRADNWGQSLTEAGSKKVRNVIYTSVIDWLGTEEGREFLRLGERAYLERKVSEASGAVEKAKNELVLREQELNRWRAKLAAEQSNP